MDKRIELIKTLTKVMDNGINILGFKFGLDPILGLVPGGGDLIAAAISIYIIYLAHQAGAPSKVLKKMGMNVALDTLLGTVPVAGDILDFAFKANQANLKLLEEHIQNSKTEQVSL